jgi:uncharacterized protein (TIGR00730 family)
VSPPTVAVFCSARDNLAPAFVHAARDIGTLLATRRIGIVYGGGGGGLMGELATAALHAGGRVTGVIPRSMVEAEKAHRGVSELIVIDTMHERKQIMADRADAFLALPGGVGTLDEIFEAITWNQLAIHDKPVGFLDVDGFYAPLRAFLDHAHAGGFIPESTMKRLKFESRPESLLKSVGLPAN